MEIISGMLNWDSPEHSGGTNRKPKQLFGEVLILVSIDGILVAVVKFRDLALNFCRGKCRAIVKLEPHSPQSVNHKEILCVFLSTGL